MFTKEWYKTNPHPRPMLGKKHSKETREKMHIAHGRRIVTKMWRENISKAKRGKPRSEETKRRISETRKIRVKMGLIKSRFGQENNLWKGGVSKENHVLRQRKEYIWWREAVFARDNYTCQFCGARSQKGKFVIIQADHIKPFAIYPELRYAIDNGRTLCNKCHKKTDTFPQNLRKECD